MARRDAAARIADPAGAGDAAGGAVHDTVLAFHLLHLLPDLDTALPAILAALKPGGRFISKTPCLREMHPAVPRLLVPLLRAVGLAIEAVERHGSGRRDMRVFIVARQPL